MSSSARHLERLRAALCNAPGELAAVTRVISAAAAFALVMIGATILNAVLRVDYFYNTIFVVLISLGLSDVLYRLLLKNKN